MKNTKKDQVKESEAAKQLYKKAFDMIKSMDQEICSLESKEKHSETKTTLVDDNSSGEW